MTTRASSGDFVLRILYSRELIVALVGVGVVLRIVQYVANRSLWYDEAGLALNLVEKPLSGLVHGLDFAQAAPVGFLLTEGLVAKVLGFSEYALRVLPLVSGLISLPAFAWLARRVVSRAAAPFAVLLFVVAADLVYYSSELKPYETDVAAAVVLLALGTLVLDKRRTLMPGQVLGVALAGLALISLSFPAVLVVGAVAATFTGQVVVDRDRERLHSPVALAMGSWLIASAALAIYAQRSAQLVRQAWESASGRFLGVPGSSPVHAANAMGSAIIAAMGLSQEHPYTQFAKLALLCAVIGVFALYRRKPAEVVMIVLPIPIVFVAAAIHAYPLIERTELFLVPSVTLLIAEGAAQLVRWIPKRARFGVALIVGIALAAGPVSVAAARVVHPRKHEEIRPVLAFMRDNWRPGASLYVHSGAQPAFLYYELCKCLDLSQRSRRAELWPLKPLTLPRGQTFPLARSLSPDVILGGSVGQDWQRNVQDLRRVDGHRYVWFLYSHTGGNAPTVGRLVDYLTSIGTRISSIDRPGAHAYLYRLQ